MSVIGFLLLIPGLILAEASGTQARFAAGDAAPDSATAVDSMDTGVADADSLPWRLRARPLMVTGQAGAYRVLEPVGVATDAFGRIYVTDAGSHRLVRYDARGAWIGESGTLGSGLGQMRRPGAVAALGSLSIAVLDRENRRVLSYDLFGRLLGTLIDLESETLDQVLGRVDPVDLASDPGGAVYVADAERDRLLVFDFSGRYVRSVGGYGARPGSFRGLSGVAAGRRGELVTTEREGARVQRMEPGGRVLGAWALRVDAGEGALTVAVDDSSRVAVADERAGTVQLFDAAGKLLAAANGLKRPRGLAFARDGALLIAESEAGQVRRFVLEPNPGYRTVRGDE